MTQIDQTEFRSDIRAIETLMGWSRNVFLGTAAIELALATENIFPDEMTAAAGQAALVAAGCEGLKHFAGFVRQRVENRINSDSE